MAEGDPQSSEDVELARVPEDPAEHGRFYFAVANELKEYIEDSRAFEKATTPLPIFLFTVGVAVFVIGIVLRINETVIESADFVGMVAFGAVLVIGSVAVYISEIRLRDTLVPDKTVLSEAHDALEEVGKQANALSVAPVDSPGEGSEVTSNAPTNDDPNQPTNGVV